MKLAVVGAGNMGSGIAQKMATEGFEVVLVDLNEAGVERGMRSLQGVLDDAVERKLFSAEQAQQIIGRIKGTTDWQDLADVDLVVEAVFEDAGVKRDLYAQLEAVCRADTVIATNTSSFSVTDLASQMQHPERFIGLHYFYHPAKNRLVEVIAGRNSDAGLLAKAWALQEQLGKTPISCADSSGFVVNRFFVPWLNEAVRLLEEGVGNIPTIDAAAEQAFGVGMGPFALMNATGVPIAMHSSRTLAAEFGAMHEPLPVLVEHGEANREWDLSGDIDESRFGAIGDHLKAAVFQVAARLVDEGVGSIEDTDIGARVGLRWPKGPFELMNETGIEQTAKLVEAVCKRWDLAFPEVLENQRRSGEPFTFELVKTAIEDGVATLTINRPDAMNALNEEVVSQLAKSFHAVDGKPEVRAIVLAGSGKAFVAGADIKFFVDNIERKTIDRTVQFTAEGQALFNAIDDSEKTVVARMSGLALGGGLELALACDYIVAAERATVGFPETGIGIYPGLGGTQRTPRRIGVGMAKFLVCTGQTLSAAQARAIGLIDEVVALDALDDAVAKYAAMEPVTQCQITEPPAEYSATAAFFAGASYEDMIAAAPDNTDARLAKALQRMQSKAPIATRLCCRLIEQSASVSLQDGLASELEHLTAIFSTRDAYNGLRSVGSKPPAYEDA
tara:strand:- start:35793 stop:37811 length:2019 start_codon:yes stop_codon:yes gene_type:complete